MKRTIVFVYNADSGIWSKYLDFAHKIISPSTYSCGLCGLTHGSFLENKAWKEFREAVPHQFIFKYKDSFLKEMKGEGCQELEFPIILEQKENRLDILMYAEELNLIDSTEDLVDILQKKLA
ncbi:GTPase [uncultured Aquimarina sp.]|uniref:GTPase n=1 Tax=uncultured Aquimarina sp. TaxID=575652 RepID=UPI00260F3693|nr:GTPase [uncultured Aquimarina sp.]